MEVIFLDTIAIAAMRYKENIALLYQSVKQLEVLEYLIDLLQFEDEKLHNYPVQVSRSFYKNLQSVTRNTRLCVTGALIDLEAARPLK